MTQINSDEIKEWAISPDSHPSGINCAQVETIKMAYPDEQHLLKIVYNPQGIKLLRHPPKLFKGS